MKNDNENEKIVNAQDAGNIISADEKLVDNNKANTPESKDKKVDAGVNKTPAAPEKVRMVRAETY